MSTRIYVSPVTAWCLIWDARVGISRVVRVSMVTLYKAGVGVGTKDSWCGKRACQQEIIASTGIKSGLPMPRHAAVFSRARVFSAITELVGEIRFRSLRSHDTDTSNVLRSDRCPVIIVIAVVSVVSMANTVARWRAFLQQIFKPVTDFMLATRLAPRTPSKRLTCMLIYRPEHAYRPEQKVEHLVKLLVPAMRYMYVLLWAFFPFKQEADPTTCNRLSYRN